MVDTTGEWDVMQTEFLKWGNSLALRVPGAFAKELGEGKRAEVTVENGALVIKVVRPRKRRRYRLQDCAVGAFAPGNRGKMCCKHHRADDGNPGHGSARPGYWLAASP